MKSNTYHLIPFFYLVFVLSSFPRTPDHLDSNQTIYNFHKCLDQSITPDKSDRRFFGRWLAEGDSIYFGMQEYGVFFSDSDYQNVTIYDLPEGLSLYFKGFGRWYTKDGNLYLCTVWLKAKCHFNAQGRIDSVYYRDTTFMGWHSYPYSFHSDTTWCWQWQVPGSLDEHFWKDPILRIKQGPECFHRIK